MTSSDSESNQEFTPQPMPGWMKYAGIGLAVFVLLAIIWMFSSGDDKAEAVPVAADIEKSDVSTHLAQQLSTKKTLIPPETQGVYNEPTPSETNIYDEINPIKARINQLNQQISQLTQQFDTDQKRQDEVVLSLKQQLETMNQALIALKKQVESRPKPTQRIAKKRAIKKYRKPVTVPFSLVSIDHWGDRVYAVIRFQGHLIDVSEGQQLAGWTVTAINPDLGKVFIKGSHGRIKKLSIK